MALKDIEKYFTIGRSTRPAAPLNTNGDASNCPPAQASSGAFHLPAVPRIGRSDPLLRIVDTFAPANPVSNPEYFVGRLTQRTQLVAAIEEHRNHLLLIGPRGSGKTSLALCLLAAANKQEYLTVYLSCSRSSSFDSVFRSAFAAIPLRYDSGSEAGNSPNKSFASLADSETLTSQTVGELLSRVSGTRILIALDEIDLVHGGRITTEILELMKHLSDHAAAVHMILIGVAGSFEDIFGQQHSIPRSLFRMKLDHMTDNEVAEVIKALTKMVHMDIDSQALEEMVRLAQGKLFVAKLVALKAAKIALGRASRTIEMIDFHSAMDCVGEYFHSAGYNELQAMVRQNPSLQAILRTIIRTIREAGDRFTVDQISGQCEFQPGLQRIPRQQVESVLQTLAESGNFLSMTEQGGESTFQFIDPDIELALALASHEAA